jgi:gamma-tubulin complex component 3
VNVHYSPGPSGATASLSGDGGFDGHFMATTAVDEDGEEVSGQQLWENKFLFRKEMVPTFVSEEFGRKVGLDKFRGWGE